MFRSLGANIWDHEMPIRFGGIPLWHRMNNDPTYQRWPCRPFAHETRPLRRDFDQIIVGHGAVVENNGKEVFRTAFRWLLK